MRVAMSYNIVVADCDRGRIKATVNSRLVAEKELKNVVASVPSEVHAIANDGVLHVGEKRRRDASARHVAARQNADDHEKQLPSCKLQRPFTLKSNSYRSHSIIERRECHYVRFLNL